MEPSTVYTRAVLDRMAREEAFIGVKDYPQCKVIKKSVTWNIEIYNYRAPRLIVCFQCIDKTNTPGNVVQRFVVL